MKFWPGVFVRKVGMSITHEQDFKVMVNGENQFF